MFVVLHGEVKMFYREGDEENYALLQSGDIFFATAGTDHVAHPMKHKFQL